MQIRSGKKRPTDATDDPPALGGCGCNIFPGAGIIPMSLIVFYPSRKDGKGGKPPDNCPVHHLLSVDILWLTTNAETKRLSSSAILQILAIVVEADRIVYRVFALGSRDVTLGNCRPVDPLASVMSCIFLNITVHNCPAGCALIGLYGSITPKTVHNFETLLNVR